jgi:hypothetical protein
MLPLFLAPRALQPLKVLPGGLHVMARINTRTYESLLDVGVTAIAALALRAYPKTIL